LIAILAAGCNKEPQVMQPKDGELPPLPPASGTSIGYLVDGAKALELREEQIKKLKEIDSSLAARNDSIDTQLRTIEKPDVEEAQKRMRIGQSMRVSERRTAPGIGQNRTGWAEGLAGL